MKIKIKTDKTRNIRLALPNFMLFGSLGAKFVTRMINEKISKDSAQRRVSEEDMRKIFRMMRHVKMRGRHFLELEVGEDVKIVI